jgi:predicted RNase H-like nuclease
MAARRCFGLDAAWSARNPSAICMVDDEGTILAESVLGGDDEIARWITARLRGPAVVAADLPLRVPNATGMRPCDREVMRAYGGRGAGPHPANRSLLEGRDGRIRGERLASMLAEEGFGGPWDGTERTLVEVYPHPGLIEVFGLPRRLAYKKGPLTRRRTGLAELRDLLATLASADPPLRGPAPPDPTRLRGRALKGLEDLLDARFCAWTALVWARSGRERVRLFGDPDGGHIAIPVSGR